MTTATLDLGIDRREINDREAALIERAAKLADDFATRAEQHDREGSFPFENFEAMHEAGYMKQCLPAAFGGEDVTLEELCLTQERLAWGDASTALGANMHSFFCGVMAEAYRVDPDQPQWQLLFGMVAQGKTTLGGAISERDSADPFNFPSGTVEKVEGGFKLNGMKVFGSNSAVSPFLFFSGALDEDGERKVLSFQVPRGTPGATIVEDWDTLGMRATGSYTTVFKDCVVPEMFKQNETPYGAPAGVDPFQAAFLCWFEPTVASVYTGVAALALKLTREGVINKSRLPYGEVKHYASVQYGLAEMVIGLEASRAFIRRTAQRIGSPERRDLEAIGLAVATKVFATEQAARIVDTGMQVIGGGAFFKRNPLERLYRDVRAGKFHPPSHYDALESVGKAYLGIERGPQRFL